MLEDARAELKVCVLKCKELATQVNDLRALKYAADLQIQDADALVAEYSDLDAKISAYRVEALKRKENPRKLPPELKSQQDERKSAIEELEWARSTHEQVSADLATAERELSLVEEKRRRLAVEVLKRLGEQVCDELTSINRQRLKLVQLLEGLIETNAVIDGRSQFIGRTPEFVAAIEGEYAAPWPGGITPAQAYAKRWGARLQVLLNDPDAEITVPKPITPSDLIIGSVPQALMGMALAIPFELRPEE